MIAGDHRDQTAEDRLVEVLAVERSKRDDYIDVETVFVAMFPFFYGLLTFLYSNSLWNPNGVHASALKVPGAPESWGATFVALSTLVVWSALRRRRRALIVSCMASAIVFATFMVIVLTAQVAYPRTLGQAVVYGIFALLFLNRARLAWVT